MSKSLIFLIITLLNSSNPAGEDTSFIFTGSVYTVLSFSAYLSSSASAKAVKWPLFIYSNFQLTMKVGLSIKLNCRPVLKNDFFFA